VEQGRVELEAVADTGPQSIGFIGLAGAAPVAEAIGSVITAGGGGGTDSRCCGLVGAVGGGLAADKHQEPQRQESISENVGRNSHGGHPLKFARFLGVTSLGSTELAEAICRTWRRAMMQPRHSGLPPVG